MIASQQQHEPFDDGALCGGVDYEDFTDYASAIAAYARDGRKVVWAPQKGPQKIFLECPIYEVFYGGAAGGAKSESLLMDFIRDVDKWGAAWKGILFRKTYPQLEELICRSLEIFPSIVPGAKFREQKKTWLFPKGETLKFRALDRFADCTNFQGHSYTWEGWDELTHWKADAEYEFMKIRCRSTNKKVPRRIRATGNPGFVGHQWVKAYFVDNGAYTVIANAEGLQRTFIPSTLDDNPILDKNDPDYRKRIEAIKDDALRKALLYGDWDVVVGAALGSVFFRRKHVIAPLFPPSNWFTNRVLDWGSSRPFSIQYWTESNGEQLPDGRIFPQGAKILFHEIYGVMVDNRGIVMPNVGVQWSARKIAGKMNDFEKRLRNRTGCQVTQGPADLDIFTRQDDHCIYDNFLAEGVQWDKASKGKGSLATGLELIREALDPEHEDRPMMYVCNNCIHWLRTVPTLVRDPLNWEVVQAGQEDHSYDGTRYFFLAPKPFVPSGQQHWK
jgi:hypothetical protein